MQKIFINDKKNKEGEGNILENYSNKNCGIVTRGSKWISVTQWVI